jgi:hypothetical protein
MLPVRVSYIMLHSTAPEASLFSSEMCGLLRTVNPEHVKRAAGA